MSSLYVEPVLTTFLIPATFRLGGGSGHEVFGSPARSGGAPWLCGFVSRRGCLCRKGLALVSWSIGRMGKGMSWKVRTGRTFSSSDPFLGTGERGSQDSNLESPVLETGALASWATAPRGRIVTGRGGSAETMRAEGFEPPRAEAHQDLNLARLPNSATPAWLPRRA